MDCMATITQRCLASLHLHENWNPMHSNKHVCYLLTALYDISAMRWFLRLGPVCSTWYAWMNPDGGVLHGLHAALYKLFACSHAVLAEHGML
jgi:hypothetical protein